MEQYPPGKKYVVSGGLLNQVMQALKTLRILPGPGYHMSVRPGVGTTLRIEPRSDAETLPWRIVAGSAPGTYRVAPGTVAKGFLYDAESAIGIANIDLDITLAAGDLVWLELTPALGLTVESGPPTWEGWPYAVETELDEEAENLPVMKLLRYPLWQVVSSADAPAGSVPLDADIAVRRMAPATHLQIVPWVQEGSEGRVVAAWMFMIGPGTVIDPS